MEVRSKAAFSFGIVVAFLQPGCALWSGGEAAREPGFQSRATSARNAMPLPVEIAQEIAVITEEGALVMQDSPPVEPEKEPTPVQKAEQGQSLAKPEEKPKAGGSVQRRRESDRTLAKARSKSGPLGFGKLLRKKGKGRRTASASGGGTVYHRVKIGDTLMKISFEKYGNVYRWREIYNDNRSRIFDFNNLKVGTVLTINNVEYIYIKKNGKPYLIRRGDTLIGISNQLYGTPVKWRHLWRNNPQLIHDPNKIYAGFTLYYEPPKKEEQLPVRLPAKTQ